MLTDGDKVTNATLSEKFAKTNKEIAEGSYGVISPELRAELHEAGIFTVEIKSTKVNAKNALQQPFLPAPKRFRYDVLLSTVDEEKLTFAPVNSYRI